MRKQVFLLAIPAAVLVWAAGSAYAAEKAADEAARWRAKLDDSEKIVHALNRLTYGPRPGDIEQLRKLGLKKWIDRQLNPGAIQESPVLAAKLKELDTLEMSIAEMVREYPVPQVIRGVATGRMDTSEMDPEKRIVMERLVERYRERLQQQQKGEQPDEAMPESKRNPRRRPATTAPKLDPEKARVLRQGSPEEKIALLRSMPASEFDSLVVSLPPAMRRQVVLNAPTDLRRKMIFSAGPGQVVAHDLTEGKLLRAIMSERQLEEVLTDFWYNHFNVFLDKGADRFLVTSYERDAIRPHVLGKFRDMLAATAKHPAMLFYLDNWQSVDPKAVERLQARFRRAAPQQPAQRRARGINENYARELLELHTLGVDGGYSQKDIMEVARCFTGWTLREPRRGAEFQFAERVHDNGAKTVLGVMIPAGGGMDDGMKVLDILVKHPSTAKFISRKLAQRFVADAPPDALVARMAETFRKTDGDLKAVMKTMLEAPEFWTEGAWRAKMKSPLEMMASATRALGADVSFGFAMGQQLNTMGQPLYRKQEPTGYSNLAEEWVNSAALLARMNFAIALAQNKVPGVKVDSARLDAKPADLARKLLFREPPPETVAALKDASSPAHMAGLIIGGPEFQRR